MDKIFSQIECYLHKYPSTLISALALIVCSIFIRIMQKNFAYTGLCCYLAVTSIISNVQLLYSTYYAILHMQVVLGTVTFCSSFLACDLINKYYGATKAKQSVWLVICCDMLFLLSMIVAVGHKPYISNGDDLHNINAIKRVFLQTPRFLVASYITYFVSQRIEIYLFNMIDRIHFIKSHFVKHNCTLFISSVVIDTLLFTLIAFWLLSPTKFAIKALVDIFASAVITRVVCNFFNSILLRYFTKDYKKEL